MGNRDIEDSLERLNELTQEEARMASAELLKMTHSVDWKVKGVDDRVKSVEGKVQDVRGDVQEVGNIVLSDVQDARDKVQVVDDKLDQANCSLSLQLFVIIPGAQTGITGNQLRDNLLRWLSPPDPSTNHNITCKAHHNGTSVWFFRGSIFYRWKSTGSFLWVHGKRTLPLTLTKHQHLTSSCFYSGIREKRSLVCPFSDSFHLVKLTVLFQFLNYTRYYNLARCRESFDGLLLL